MTSGGLQNLLMLHPEAGDTIPSTGGLRKLRFADVRRGKGKRGGLRVFYYWWDTGSQFWLFTLYDKDEMADLTPLQRKGRIVLKTPGQLDGTIQIIFSEQPKDAGQTGVLATNPFEFDNVPGAYREGN